MSTAPAMVMVTASFEATITDVWPDHTDVETRTCEGTLLIPYDVTVMRFGGTREQVQFTPTAVPTWTCTYETDDGA